MSYINDFQKEFPRIRRGVEDDLEWFDDGMRLLRRGKLRKAERLFKQLTLSQPQHPDGIEGLARTYQAMGDRAYLEEQNVITLTGRPRTVVVWTRLEELPDDLVEKLRAGNPPWVNWPGNMKEHERTTD